MIYENKDSIEGKLNTIISLLRESIAIQKNMLNFFLSIEKRENGGYDVNFEQYLTEVKKDNVIIE